MNKKDIPMVTNRKSSLPIVYGDTPSFLGTKVVALGGPWGKYSPQAPDIAREKFGMEIIDISYDNLAKRITGARADKQLVAKSKAWAKHYLAIPKTTLNTKKEYVENCFCVL